MSSRTVAAVAVDFPSFGTMILHCVVLYSRQHTTLLQLLVLHTVLDIPPLDIRSRRLPLLLLCLGIELPLPLTLDNLPPSRLLDDLDWWARNVLHGIVHGHQLDAAAVGQVEQIRLGHMLAVEHVDAEEVWAEVAPVPQDGLDEQDVKRVQAVAQVLGRHRQVLGDEVVEREQDQVPGEAAVEESQDGWMGELEHLRWVGVGRGHECPAGGYVGGAQEDARPDEEVNEGREGAEV